MAEETTQVDEQDVQTATPEGDVDYEALYHKEKKYSQSLRSRAQDAESKNEKLSLKSEEDRQAKLIAEGKKDDLIVELREKTKNMESELSVFRQQMETKKDSLLQSIPEDDRVHYESLYERSSTINEIINIVEEICPYDEPLHNHHDGCPLCSYV